MLPRAGLPRAGSASAVAGGGSPEALPARGNPMLPRAGLARAGSASAVAGGGVAAVRARGSSAQSNRSKATEPAPALPDTVGGYELVFPFNAASAALLERGARGNEGALVRCKCIPFLDIYTYRYVYVCIYIYIYIYIYI